MKNGSRFQGQSWKPQQNQQSCWINKFAPKIGSKVRKSKFEESKCRFFHLTVISMIIW